MDASAELMKMNTGISVNYGCQIGKAINVGTLTVRFFELSPKQETEVWVETMPQDTCLRANVLESGRSTRENMAKVREILKG